MVTPVCATLEAVLVAAAVCEPAKEAPVTIKETLGVGESQLPCWNHWELERYQLLSPN